MTRANIDIIQEYAPKTAKLVVNSDGYPSNVVPALIDFLLGHLNKQHKYHKDMPLVWRSIGSTELQKLLNDTYATIGRIFNFSYYYEVNLVKGTIKAWDYKFRWVNAPENWQERGWVCNETKNGKAGYTNFVKGKLVFETSIEYLLENKTIKVDGNVIEISQQVEAE